jgi:hypothetical protein
VRRAIVAFLLIVGCASATVAQPAPDKPSVAKPAVAKPAAARAAKSAPAIPADNRPCIGIVSRLGESFTVKKVGILVFQNEEHAVPIEAWRIDDLVASRIEDSLKGQVAVRRISYPQGAFASLDEPQLFRDRWADLGTILRTVVAGTHCARYIVVTPSIKSLASSNQTINGLGILSYGGVNLHALFALNLYEGDTFTRLRSAEASLGPSTIQSLLFERIRGPHREVDKSLWPESLDIARNANLRDATRQLVEQSLNVTLPELKPLE